MDFNMKSPEISVIIPTFNYGQFISEAIDSVLSQSFKDFEIIVVDDGSTDNTRDICMRYGPKIRYIYQENAGVSTARNKGMSLAFGRYVCFFDSDDMMMPYKLEVQRAFMEKASPEIGFTYSDFSRLESSKVLSLFSSKKYFNIFFQIKDLRYEDIFSNCKTFRELSLSCPEEYLDRYIYFGNIFKTLIMGNFILLSSAMVRRECLEDFNPNLSIYEDYELVCRLSKKYVAGYLDIPTFFYRKHENSLSHKDDERMLKSDFDIVEKVWHRDSFFYTHFKKEIDKALALRAYALGRYYLSKKSYAEALIYFKESLYNKKSQKGCYAFLLWSYMNARLRKA